MNKLRDSQIYRLCCRYIFPVIIFLYPLRHINIGLDLADTGYNYANFRYMGLEHMDSMWLFSTYLANAAGHILTLLPGGHTLLFMNLYTALFISAIAIISYVFLTKKVKIPEIIVFVGEFAAISLCWAPSAALYNYMTYMLFLICVIFIYEGLTREKKIYLIAAGAVLGSNVFVRFSNLPQAVLIVAVWAYGVICRKKVKEVIKETGFCMLGYVSAVVLWLGFISLRYGFMDYAEGIRRLFAMTDSATDYKASSMLYGMFHDYIQNLYWFNRILIFLAPGAAVCIFLPKIYGWIKRIISIIFAAAALVWLYSRNFCNFYFYDDGAVYRPGVLFLMLTVFICMLRIFSKKAEKNEKLLAGMIVLTLFITSIGSNNRLLPSINNLFLAAPYVLWNIYRLCRVKDIRLFAFKAAGVAFMALFLVQCAGFGVKFVFVESEERGKPMDTKVESSNVLKGMRMSFASAEQMKEIDIFVSENQLSGREVILYGDIPSLSFYLEMPSSFNPWSDLESYSRESMEAAIGGLKQELSEGAQFPVVILNRSLIEGTAEDFEEDEKLALIFDYMEEYGYEKTFSNEKFVLYDAH